MFSRPLLKKLSLRCLGTSCALKRALTTVKYYSVDASKIVRSAVNIDIPDVTLDEYVWQKLHKWENKIALQCSETGRSYQYIDVYKQSRALAHFLRDKVPQLKERDTLAIILPNVPEYPLIMLGIIQAGFKLTTVNSVYKSNEIYKQLLNSEAKFIFTSSQLLPEVNRAIQLLQKDIPIAIVKHEQSESLPKGVINFQEMVEKHFEDSIQTNRSVEDVILIPYSSGTTGLPKGVELTHKSIVANLCQMSTPPFTILNDSEGSFQEVVPAILPMYHIYGMVTALLNGLATGSKLITIRKFNPEAFVNTLTSHRPSVAYLTPPTVLFMLNNSDVHPETLNPIRVIVSGAAPLGALDINRLQEKSRGRTNFIQMYGLTECSPLTHTQTLNAENGVEVGGVGLTVPNTDCLIVSTDKQERQCLNANSQGELLIRGPQVMKGYYKNPQATNETKDADGWLKTGDIAYFNENGHLFVTDRLKELIKVKGFQVAPAELEEVLRDHPSIDDAAVIGIPDSNHGEVPKAFVVLKKNTQIQITDILKYVSSKVAHFKQLRGGVVIIGSVPRSPSGKILRRDLKLLTDNF